jgi:hypothetical protein
MVCVIAEPCIGVTHNSSVQVCPVDATFAEDHLPSEWLGYAQINPDHYKPRTAN